MPSLTSAGLLAYKALLHLYPRTFQHRFAGDMLRDFRDGGSDAFAQSGWKGEVAHMWHAYTDVVLSLARERGSARGAVIGGLSVLATFILFTVPTWSPPPGFQRPPAREISAEELMAVLLVLGLCLLIALVIVLTTGVVNPLLQRRRQPPVRRTPKRGVL